MKRKMNERSDELNLLIHNLQDKGFRTRFAAGYKLSLRARELGEFVGTLLRIAANNRSQSRHTAIGLLKSLGNETTTLLSNRISNIICPTCLVHFRAYQVKLPFDAMLAYQIPNDIIVYYACSNCGKSQDFLDAEGSLAILDNEMQDNYVQCGNTIRINWLLARSLCYFSQVEIIRATDEEVERFAVQVGNDTDEKRKIQNKLMRCLVATDCKLAENTIRILKHLFGQIEIIA